MPIAFAFALLCGCTGQPDQSVAEISSVSAQEVQAIQINNLLRDSIGLAEDVEVVMSYVEVPKNSTLPTHWHPGEEFVYMLEGGGEVFFNDGSSRVVRAGDVAKVPLKFVHRFSTTEQSARMIVFRVHEKGQPDRVLVE